VGSWSRHDKLSRARACGEHRGPRQAADRGMAAMFVRGDQLAQTSAAGLDHNGPILSSRRGVVLGRIWVCVGVVPWFGC
jgi:hypothetical protein